MDSKTSFFLSIFLCFTFCNYAQTINHKFQPVKSPIILQVNNKDYKQIGFEFIASDQSIGIKSIILADSVIYLLDAYHNNIKKINLTTGKLSSSLPLSNSNAWLRDLAIFDNKLFVTTDLATNYILDLNLHLITHFTLPTETKYVYKVFRDSLLIYDFGKVIAINNEGKELYTRNENIDVLSLAHGKEYTIVGNTIKTKYGIVRLNSSFPYTWKYYDAINIDFNDKELVYYEVNPYYLKIFIQPIIPK